MGSESSKPEETHDVAEIAELKEFDRVSTAAPNPQLGGGLRPPPGPQIGRAHV